MNSCSKSERLNLVHCFQVVLLTAPWEMKVSRISTYLNGLDQGCTLSKLSKVLTLDVPQDSHACRRLQSIIKSVGREAARPKALD